MKIEGAVVLVTGGANGIGKLITIRMLEKGAKLVAILDFDDKGGQATQAELGGKFGDKRIKFIQCDVTNQEQLTDSFQKAYDEHKRLDVVINNAGIGKEIMATIAINLVAVINGTQLAAKLMSKTNGGNGGVLINVSSMAGVCTTIFPIYSASKFGVLGFTLSLPLSDPETYSTDNIRVNAVCPSFIRTQLAADLMDNMSSDMAKVFNDDTVDYVTFTTIVDAYQKIIEDDSIHCQAVTVTPKKGIWFHAVPSQVEFTEEYGFLKA